MRLEDRLIPDPEFPALLEREIERFSRNFPGLSLRLCRRMGRRISHLAGDTSVIHSDELRLEMPGSIVMMVSGPWKGLETRLREYALELAGILGDTVDRA